MEDGRNSERGTELELWCKDEDTSPQFSQLVVHLSSHEGCFQPSLGEPSEQLTSEKGGLSGNRRLVRRIPDD